MDFLSDYISLSSISALLQVIMVDLVLAGDNAIVVGLVAAGLPRDQRTKVIVIGIAAATLMRVGFALVTTQLLQIIGLTLAGGILLLWVSWKLWRELREQAKENEAAAVRELDHAIDGDPDTPPADTAPPRKTFRQAVTQIVIADVSMSLDNVLAVAGVAREHTWVLIIGLVLSVAFMGAAATLIARLLKRYHWIAYVGLAIIFYVSLAMIWEGSRAVIEAAETAGLM
jgi:YjbE family integral membrane protein